MSKRELILQNLQAVISEIEDIKTVLRIPLQFEDLESYPATQLPLVGIVGRLPKPVQKLSGRRQGQISQVRSALPVSVHFFAIAREEPDTQISYFCDLLWRAILADTTRGKDENGKPLSLNTEITPELDAGIFPPHVAFILTLNIEYIHNINGI